MSGEVRFREAYRRAWVGNSSGTVRYSYFAFGCFLMLGVQIAMFVVVDNPWALLAVPALPAAAWFLLSGWVYQRLTSRVLGLALFVLGAMVPFYLM